MRVTAICGEVAVDVEVDEGVPAARLRPWLARLTGSPAWLAPSLCADGVALHDEHTAGRPPLCHGAVLRPGSGPLPVAVTAARAALHVAVVGGPDAGALLVPESCLQGPGEDAVRGRGVRSTVGPSGTLPVADPTSWLVHLRARRPLTHGGPAPPATDLLWVRAACGSATLRRGGRRRERPVPRWRYARWRVGDELRAGGSVLVLRARPGGAPPAPRPARRWWRRVARLMPALAGAATSAALAVAFRQPVLAIGALSALLLVGRPAAPEPPTDPAGAPAEPADLAALRVAIARARVGAPAAGPRLAPEPGRPATVRLLDAVPWVGDLAVVGPRDAALAAARALLLAALGPDQDPPVALVTDRPADWGWIAWCARAAAGPPGAVSSLVVLDGPEALSGWFPGHRVLRLPPGAAPAWCDVLETDGRAAALRPAGHPVRAVPVVGVSAPLAEEMARLGGRTGVVAPTQAAGLPLAGCPADVILGDLPGVPGADPAAVARAWDAATAALVVPVGRGPDGAPVLVDLVADGPHALVAGTTGSGKSQLLTTLVVALAATHPPSRLSVLLVDFKGGTGLGALAGLPHVVGHLSDLDAAGARRTLRALAAELRRRERILAAAGVSDLRELPAAAPPRLLVIADEFRVLADELPDLIPSLARLAAQGRSLGVHLVLATQRPTGAVPPDLRANVALRVVLRVADAADSADLVGVGDAARIDRPGLAVLARGAGRPEPVQVARAAPRRGAPVRLAAPWPGSSWAPATRRFRGDDADAWVAAIRAAWAGRPCAQEPWLPELPTLVRPADVPPGPGLPLALADMPDDLARAPVRWDPDGGHLLVVGGPGSGRSTTLAALAAAALADGRAVHAVGLPPSLRPPGLASALDAADVTRVARLVRVLAAGRPSTTRRPLLLIDDVAAALAELAGLARGAPAELLEGLWATAGGPVAVVAGGAVGPATARLAPGFADRLVLGSPDPTADLLAGVPADLAGPRPVPGRAAHLGRAGAVLCQVALPDGPAPGSPRPAEPPGVLVRSLPRRAARPPDVRVVTADGVALGVGGDTAGVVRVDLSRSLLVVGPPGSGRSTALRMLADAAAAAGEVVVHGSEGPPGALLVIDDLDEAELGDALAPPPPARLLVATTTSHAVTAFRGLVPALVRARRLLVLDPAEPGSGELLGPEGAWLVDPHHRPPGRGALRTGRDVIAVQVWAPPVD